MPSIMWHIMSILTHHHHSKELAIYASPVHWGPSKVIIYHPRVIISPQKCAPIPQNKSFSHIYLTSQKWFTYVVLSENVASRIFSLWLVNYLLLAMPAFWEHLVPQPLPKLSYWWQWYVLVYIAVHWICTSEVASISIGDSERGNGKSLIEKTSKYVW